METFGIYATAINYPTVALGDERLRITPGPFHTDGMMDEFVWALGEALRGGALPLNPAGGSAPRPAPVKRVVEVLSG